MIKEEIAMNKEEIAKIKEKIELLPKGNITVKHINGKPYEYWQFRENGRQIVRRVKGDELNVLTNGIKERKRLERLLKEQKNIAGDQKSEVFFSQNEFESFVRIGSDLRNFVEPVRGFRERAIINELRNYLFSKNNDRVFILYGLRRTGKTTMIRQVILSMPEDMKEKTAFIQVRPRQDLSSLHRDLKKMEAYGFRYIFIDEVTLLNDFIEGASMLSDIFAASGMKIVLSGTDSLGFLFAEDEQLYDRCDMLHSTFIPYREFEYVLGMEGIDNYIAYGGTMSISGTAYNDHDMLFSSLKATNEYIDSSIARNIQHSLKNYQYEGHFRALHELYERDELTNAINRVVEDMNHRFILDVLTRTFQSHDLGVSRTNLLADRNEPTDILEMIDLPLVTRRLKDMLEIKNKEERSVTLDQEHVSEIKEYFEMLDMIKRIEIRSSSGSGRSLEKIVFTQSGLRYAQAKALIISLMQDEAFLDIPIKERNRVSERILSEIRGRMMEDIVLLETSMAYPDKEVFVLQFASGEFDMVVADPVKGSCRIYEIKHSSQIASGQYRHLKDREKLELTRRRYGDIEARSVIYNGDDGKIDEIEYVNVERYLRQLG